jgi:cation transport regulator ChaB
MSDIEWLTLDETAARLGISRESARRTALRKRWGKRPGNDGRVRIGVPIERLSRGDAVGQDAGRAAGHDVGPGAGHATGPAVGHEYPRIAVLEAALEGLKALVAEAGKRADAADRRAEELRQAHATEIAALAARLEETRQDRDRWHVAATARRSWWPWRRSA